MTLSFEKNTKVTKKVNLVPLDSDLWNTYTGAKGNVSQDIRPLLLARPRIQTPSDKLEEAIATQTLFENLSDQMRFYPADYLAVPYLVAILERRAEEKDFHTQLELITELGVCLATDIPGNQLDVELPHPDRKIMDDYNASIAVLQERTKVFLEGSLTRIQWLCESEKIHFYLAVLAILGDREAAFILNCTLMDECYVMCGECDYCDETIEPFSARNPSSIRPARLVTGKWDGKSLKDIYVWFSNLVDLLGDRQAVRALTYYYGIYTCPKCGAKGRVMDLMKKYFFEV